MKVIRLKTSQGSGKSHQTDKFIAEFVRQGKAVLLAVPNGDLAVEHKSRLKGHGVESFCLMSHRLLFKHIAKFDCPSFDDIDYQQKLGVDTRITKKQFCSKCPLKPDCPYPGQYKKASEEDHKVVIIQHAHFSCKETIFQIINQRKFDLLVIDEDFLGALTRHLKITQLEVEVLSALNLKWASDLADWFRNGGYPGATINPSPTDLEVARTEFDNKNAPWRITDFIRFYNDRTYYDRFVGVLDFHMPPESIPIWFLTDATTPKELLELVLDCEIEEYGSSNNVFDYKAFNEDTEVIQVLDSTMSKRALEKNDGDLLYAWLQLVGDLGRTKHKHEKILVTLYKAHKNDAKEWLGKNYPDVLERVTFNHLSVGTNAFENFPVQFLICGVHFAGKHYHYETYILKSIANIHNRRHNRLEQSNPFPYISQNGEDDDVTWKPIPIVRTEQDGVYEYSLNTREPRNFYHRLVHYYTIGKTQQAGRIRFHTGEKRTLYIAGNMNLPSFAVKSVLLDTLIGYQYKPTIY